MDSETKKDELNPEKTDQANAIESDECEEECDCIYCIMQRRPKLQFVKTKSRRRWYYQTPGKKDR